MHDQELGTRFQRMKAIVLSRKPVLRSILERYGRMSLHNYSEENLNPPIVSIPRNRKAEFLECFRFEVERLFGADTASKASAHLDMHYFVSTADHHGPLCHPFFLNSNLVMAMPLDGKEGVEAFSIVLATGSISLGNHTFPRGLLFHTASMSGWGLHRIPFMVAENRKRPVIHYPAYSREQVVKAFASARMNVPHTVLGRLSMIESIYSSSDVLCLKDYADQITVTNSRLWPTMLNRASAPKLVYLQIENVVTRLLLEHHLEGQTFIRDLLFDESVRSSVATLFDGIQGAFETDKKKGTYLFWALPTSTGVRTALWLKGRRLESDDGSYFVDLTPAAIRSALQRGEIYPGLMLSYVLLAFYYGLRCLGGFCQVNYLTEMKHATEAFLKGSSYASDLEWISGVTTDKLGEDMSVAFVRNPRTGETCLATGLDLALYGNGDTWDILRKQADLVTLEEALDSMMPDCYPVVCDEGSPADPLLSELKSSEIIKLIGLDQKTMACCEVAE